MHILLVDDHPLFCVGFAHALQAARPGLSVEIAPTLQQGLDRAAEHGQFDIALIDYRLGERNGIEGQRQFAVQHPLVARLLISGYEDPALAASARAAGASGFLGKSLGVDEILARLDTVAGGGLAFDLPAAAPSPGGPTARQMEVLSLIAQGLPNKRIADELGIAERTVKLHITALLDSLGARNRTHLLVVARERGML